MISLVSQMEIARPGLQNVGPKEYFDSVPVELHVKATPSRLQLTHIGQCSLEDFFFLHLSLPVMIYQYLELSQLLR